jgi:hypothetical protein
MRVEEEEAMLLLQRPLGFRTQVHGQGRDPLY